MAQIGTTNLVPMDFETIKADLKTYLKNQSTLKDIDFEASNINVLIDMLAYNTFHNSFYLNMVASEMFLDTAQLRDSAVSHAKMLNYLPQSFRSAKAIVDIEISPSNPDTVESILIPKGASFTTRVGSNNYTFTTSENIVVVNDNDTFNASGVELYEGRYINETFIYKTDTRFVLSNPNIDTTSINVVVVDSSTGTTSYARSESFLDVSSESAVFFLQAAENAQYEVLFGDNVFGRRPTNGSTVIVEYRISSGQLPNGATVFESDGPLGGASNIVVTARDAATGGAVPESIEEVKFRAPLAYATQQRAITSSDYSTLIRSQFPDIAKVGVFGGENMSPPRYGKVVISMISDAYDAITETRQNDVVKYIATKTPLTITPVIVNPEFTYISIASSIDYNINHSSKSGEDIRLLALTAIKNYASANINDFNTTLYYSRLIAAIDAADPSIICNTTEALVYKIITPAATVPFTGIVDFGNKLYNGPSIGSTHAIDEVQTVKSTYFTFENKRCTFEDDGDGNINIYTSIDGEHTAIKTNVGSINYDTGLLTFNSVAITNYEGDGVRLYAKLADKNIAATYNTVLLIKDNDININVNAKRA